ncbi:hypothetical protein [Microbulbifer sp.]|uniref:hypothetical protein n=1 Tax=Microbulbifer sp. TaxID=1908541 RepID=UPI003F3D87A4
MRWTRVAAPTAWFAAASERVSEMEKEQGTAGEAHSRPRHAGSYINVLYQVEQGNFEEVTEISEFEFSGSYRQGVQFADIDGMAV